MKSTDWIINHTKIVLKDCKTGDEIILLDTTGEQAKTVDGDIVAGIPFVDILDDSLDSFVFSLKNCSRRKPFSPFSLVTYTVTNEIDGEIIEDKTKLFVQFDKVQSYSRINKNRLTYEHTVSCVETAKILEKTKIFNMNLTNRNDTLLRQFEKACVNAEIVTKIWGAYDDFKKQRFFLHSYLQDFLAEKESYDFYFNNTDFRTVLDSMLATQNARVTVENVEYDPKGAIRKIWLGYIPLTTINDVEPNWTFEESGEIVAEELSNDGQDYAGKIVARGYNSVSEEPIEFTDRFKSANATLSDTTATVMLPFPISDKGFKKIILRDCELKFSRYAYEYGTMLYKTQFYDVDISEYFIPREQFDLLGEATAKDYIPFNIGDVQINVGKTYSSFFGLQESTLLKMLKYKFPPEIQYPDGKYKLDEYPTLQELVFTCSYYPLVDTVADIPKPNVYDKNTLRMGVMASQTEQTLDIDRHGKKLSGLIQRTGNTEYCLDVKAKYFCNLLPLMSRINLPNATDEDEEDYVLYKREYSMYDGFVNCRYYFSQHYNAAQANAGVNRERHLFDIPLESEETPLVIKRHLCFSDVAPTEDDSTFIDDFNSNFLYAAVETLFGFYEDIIEYNHQDKKLKYLLWQSSCKPETNDEGKKVAYTYPQNTTNASEEKPYTDSDYRFALPLCNYALGKTMNFAARPLDNYSVGYTRDGYKFSLFGDGGNMMTYNQYVDGREETVGECESFMLDYAFDFKDEKKYDLVSERGNFTRAMKTEILLYYHKDRTQRPLFVLSVDCIPAKRNRNSIIIGPEFAKNNNLVNNGGAKKALTVWTSKKYVFDGTETKLPQGKFRYGNAPCILFDIAILQENHVVKLQLHSDRLLDEEKDLKSWAIADNEGNIYLACNGNLRDIYVFMADLLQ